MLSACKPIPLSPAPTITSNACQTVSPCTLPALAPRTNGDLDAALTSVTAAWATCAARVDMIAACQASARPAMQSDTEARPHE
ncbi:Rz1-like lysis system protein LysC [Burkholderia stagnalis]|uniref:Rz1-like lysis system protein LysC n=1 Tax=Burkholderia stagnalis TaxID=1503054 RepID=UPI001E51384C|nr:Rz1-like lysis system protein LysC [Burkholderia stagnalis]MDY7807110.1 Rz1-like lysis system protein LysC [Burkholderia stagnalis]